MPYLPAPYRKTHHAQKHIQHQHNRYKAYGRIMWQRPEVVG